MAEAAVTVKETRPVQETPKRKSDLTSAQRAAAVIDRKSVV